MVALIIEHGVGEVEFLHRAGHGDVEEAAFFFEVAFVDGAFEGEGAIGEADDEDDEA